MPRTPAADKSTAPEPELTRTPAAPDLDVLDREQSAEEHRLALPTAEQVGPWGRLARLGIDRHQRGCPVENEGRGRVEASSETVAVAPGPQTRAEGIEEGGLVTAIRCLECGAVRHYPGTRRDVLRRLASEHTPSSGADTVLA